MSPRGSARGLASPRSADGATARHRAPRSWHPAEYGFAVRLLTPPFRGSGQGRPLTNPGRAALPRGGLLLLRPRCGEDDDAADRLSRVLPELRRAVPRAATVLQLPASTEGLELARHGGELGVRAVVPLGGPILQALRATLTAPLDLPRQIQEWLLLNGTRLDRLTPAVDALMEGGRRDAGYARTCAGAGANPRALRASFDRRGLPPPSEWYRLARALRMALAIQRHPLRPLLGLALEEGYGDHSSASRQLLRLFGVRPGEIRHTLGWEWLVDRWLGAARRGRPRGRSGGKRSARDIARNGRKPQTSSPPRDRPRPIGAHGSRSSDTLGH